MKVLMLLSVLLFYSCATPYQENGWRGGYSEEKVSKNSYEVAFHGNSFTSKTYVYKMLKRRCAELTLKNGYTHFKIVNRADESGEVKGYGKPANRVTIQMINNPGDDIIAYDARLID